MGIIWVKFGEWSSDCGNIFVWKRLYFRGKWTPFVRMRRRYPLKSFWNGEWPVRIEEEKVTTPQMD